ncbi:MAG: AMP-binding protein [Marinoscillum sp.]|uniref:AMP-binding protein n=1 Tax=Marinoscillum sp. TaxID=2024838 RepID=UPI0033054646
MLFKFERQKLTIGELKSGKINQNILSDLESRVVKFIFLWLSGQKQFAMRTSGSTGAPKETHLSRESLQYSARQSMEYIDSTGKYKTTLLCINPDYIGGLMVVIRSLVYDLDISMVTPTARLADVVGDEYYDLVSMVPMQVQHLLDHHPETLSQFKTILIGGAPLPPEYILKLRSLKAVRCFQTYGMTETASHIALKNLTNGDDCFEVLGDAEVQLDHRGCLRVMGSVTDHQWIQTNDVVELIDPRHFRWLGRADFVINSGGVKVHPEILEASLSSQLKMPFFVAGLPDASLGQRVVMVVESPVPVALDFSHISKYNQPREVYYSPVFSYTPSGKVNRTETLKKLNL